MNSSPSGSGRRPRAKPRAKGGGPTTVEGWAPSLESAGERSPPGCDTEAERRTPEELEERGPAEEPDEELTVVPDGEGARPREGAPTRELIKPASTYRSTIERGGVNTAGRLDKPRRVRWWARIR